MSRTTVTEARRAHTRQLSSRWEAPAEAAAPMPFGREITAVGLHSALIPHLADVPRSARVLDLGCGSGAWARRLEAAGFTDITGIDRFTHPIESEHLNLIVRDLEGPDLGLGGNRYGLITLVEVIEHMTSPGALLRHVARHLDDDGVFLITTPNIQSLIQRLKFFVTGHFAHFDSGSDPTHYQPILLEAWRRMLADIGLEIEQQWTYPEANRFPGISKAWAIGASVLQPFMKNPLPGEVLCLRLRRLRRN